MIIDRAAEHLDAFFQCDQPGIAALARARQNLRRVKTAAVIFDNDANRLGVQVERHLDARRVRVFRHIRQEFLNRTENGDFDIGRERAVAAQIQGHGQFVDGFKLLGVAPNRRQQAEVVQHHGAQRENKIAHALKGHVRGRF
ncbi:MAG: hypothetical protein HDKAJFGB_03348 [Anaerolineae bacterium]|nr:hypothetical protein [Anaerolineae bacterium]